MDIQKLTSDQIIETAYWIIDRRNYARKCGIPAPAGDGLIYDRLMAEAERRGIVKYMPPWATVHLVKI